jgi:WD40 repeat protein
MTFHGHADRVRSLSFASHPRGGKYLVSSSEGDRMVSLWNCNLEDEELDANSEKKRSKTSSKRPRACIHSFAAKGNIIGVDSAIQDGPASVDGVLSWEVRYFFPFLSQFIPSLPSLDPSRVSRRRAETKPLEAFAQ